MKQLVYFLALLVLFSCDDQLVKTGKYYPGTEDSERQLKGNPIAASAEGKFIFIDDVEKQELAKGLNDYIYVKQSENVPIDKEVLKPIALSKGGKKPKVVELKPALPDFQSRLTTNIMLDPVTLPDLDFIPADNNNGYVDWDNDGFDDDLLEIHWRCYFPRSFAWVTVAIDGQNPIMINNSIAYGAVLLGFNDVDGDGDQDVILQGGNNYKFNPDDNGLIESYSEFNVGYNTVGETPLPLVEIIDALQVVQSVNNPDFVRWDLGHFIDGVSQYEGYVFHVYWREIDPVTGEFIPTVPGYQTHTYGEWGISSSHLPNGAGPNGGSILLRITNVDEVSTPNEDCIDFWKRVDF